MKIGVIGDDFTGSSDIANTLARAGARTVQYVGMPDEAAEPGDRGRRRRAEVALDPAAEAVAQSLAACRWLRAPRAPADRLQVLLDLQFHARRAISARSPRRCSTRSARTLALVCPAFPATGRTVYQGHLFVGDRLLSESRHGEATR